MASLFSKDPGERAPLSPYAPQRIEKEIAHLKNRGSVRAAKEIAWTRGIWLLVIVVGTLLWLFFMDPVLHSFRRSDAVRTYLYLHNYGSDVKAQQLLATRVFAPNEVGFLNHQHGSYQDYFPSGAAAKQSADSLIAYFTGLANLRQGKFERLDWLGRIRYDLFVQFGLIPPTSWDYLDPAIIK